MRKRAIELLRQAGRPQGFDRGERLMMAGSSSKEVLLIESGAVKVVLSAGNGSESIVDLYGAGELIGELGVISGRPRSATVIGHEPGIAVRIPASTFRRLAADHQEILLLINETLYRRLRNADRRQIALASKSVPYRVAYQLLAWAKQRGEKTPVNALRVKGITQRELAQTVSASTKSVDAALQVLREDNLVVTGRCWYLLPDPRLLEALLDQPGWRPGAARSP